MTSQAAYLRATLSFVLPSKTSDKAAPPGVAEKMIQKPVSQLHVAGHFNLRGRISASNNDGNASQERTFPFLPPKARVHGWQLNGRRLSTTKVHRVSVRIAILRFDNEPARPLIEISLYPPHFQTPA